MHRSVVLACVGSVVLQVALLLGVSCAGDDRDGSLPSAPNDAGSDAVLLGDTGKPPPPDKEPPPGDVCGSLDGFESSSPWPLLGGCATRAGRANVAGPKNAVVSWTTPEGAGVSSPALTASGLLWVGTQSGYAIAVRPGGTVQWAHRTGGAVIASPVIDANGNVLVASTDGVLYALADEHAPFNPDASAPVDGGLVFPAPKVVFALDVGAGTSSPVLGPDGTIYLGTTDGKLVAVLADGSATKWSVPTADTRGSSPAVGQDGTVYVGSSNRSLFAIAPEGTVRWSLDLGAEVSGSPAVGGDGTVYVGASDGKLHAVSPEGKERWAYATEGAITGTPAVYRGAVYVGSEDKKLHSVSVVLGTRRWTYETLSAVATPVLDAEGVVYFGSADSRVYAVTPEGNLFFAVNAKGKVASGPAMGTASALYVTTDTGLVAIGP